MEWIAVFGMGVLLGLLGGGGGILTVPILVGFFGMPATQATGASLFVVGVASIVGSVQGFWKKEVDLPSAIMIAAPSAIGAFVARKFVVPGLPNSILGLTKDEFLLVAFAALMIVVGWRMLRAGETSAVRNVPVFITALLGLVIGLVAGTLGAGGGFLIVPALVASTSMPIYRAIGTSLIAVAAFGLTTAANYAASGLLDWSLAASFIAGGMVGSVLGAAAARRLSAAKGRLNTIFAALIVVVASYMLYRTWMVFQT